MHSVASVDLGTGSWHSGTSSQSSIEFTIPSINDGTILECRLYHPRGSKQSASHVEHKAVIIAHPYAPLGGSFEDHVVQAAGREFLSQGYVLGLFNLRGAGGSAGHTSWSSRPEQDDYTSFVGFLSCYMKELQHLAIESTRSQVESQETLVSDTGSQSHQGLDADDFVRDNTMNKRLVLVLGGYSYGSHVVRHLPDIDTVLEPFRNPAPGTAAAEIHLCATQLARNRVQEQDFRGLKSSIHSTESAFTSIHGGEICGDERQRLSKKPPRSFERLRESIRNPRRQIFKRHQSSDHNKLEKDTPTDSNVFLSPETRYLLVSPLLPPIAAFLALSTHWWKPDPAAQERLKNHQCLAIWGANDVFTSSKKLIKWATELAEAQLSKFQYVELPEIGHFWLEYDAERSLRHSLRSWIEKCDSQ